MRVGIALGSNLGDRLAHLRAAAAAVRAFAEPPVLSSRIYETAPVDCPPGSPSFLNAVLEIGFSDDLHDLIRKLQAIEQAHLRPEKRDRNAPRTVDLDVLYADEFQVVTPELQVPHPRLTQRAFVLRPLCDVAPERQLPGDDKTFRAHLNALTAESASSAIPTQDAL